MIAANRRSHLRQSPLAAARRLGDLLRRASAQHETCDLALAGRGRSVVGMDVFVEWDGTPEELGASLEQVAAGTALRLKMISNRGTVVYPARGAVPSLVDHYRCRFLAARGAEPGEDNLVALLAAVGARHRWMHVERLQEFDGERGYTLAQGEDAA